MPKNVDIVDETDDFKKDKFKAIQNAKWVVSNPHETKVVARGGKSYSLGLNYPWAVIANEILSNNIYQKASGEYNQIKLNDEIKKTQILDQKAKFRSKKESINQIVESFLAKKNKFKIKTETIS